MTHENYTPINPIQPLPSSLIVEINEWTVGDITSMGKRGKGGNFDQLLNRCKVIEDPRQVYNFDPGQSLNSSILQTGDRGVIAVLQRIMTHWRACGPHFEFAWQCSDADCLDADPKKIPWAVDLRRFLLTAEDLEAPELLEGENAEEDYPDKPVYLPGGLELIWHDRFGSMPITIGNADGIDKTAFLQNLTEEALICWKEGNRFEYLDHHTKKIMWWKIMQGKDEAALARFRKSPDKYRLNGLGRRIVQIEDVQDYLKANWINQWSAGAEDELQAHINNVEPGMFRDFDVRCPRCGLVQEVSFPLDLGFFSPSSQKKRRGKT